MIEFSSQSTCWLVDAAYRAGRVTLTFVRTDDSQRLLWTDSTFRPYYLAYTDRSGESVEKLDLFKQVKTSLAKITYVSGQPKVRGVWEADIDPALSYVYDKGLRFGTVHALRNGTWVPENPPASHPENSDLSRVQAEREDPLKDSIRQGFFSSIVQPIPTVKLSTLDLPDGEFSEEEYYKAWILSRIANLPIRQTYRSRAVSDWIRGMLNTYYRANNILIPRSEELKLGSTKQYVTGALTISPTSGTYFKMVVLDFESLYPGIIDVYNLSYETIRCPHESCKSNLVPELDYHVCLQRRGIYAAMIGALRDLRIRYYRPLTKSLPPDSQDHKIAGAATQILKLLLVSSYGVTIRIHGLASPLMGEAITAYGRHVLQTTFDMANERGLGPKYGDTDSVFLDNPAEEGVYRFIGEIKERFGLELAYERRYAVCVLSAAKKAYFGILPHGKSEIKGLSVAKSNSPRIFLQLFENCLAKLSEGRDSPESFERAKEGILDIVKHFVYQLEHGKVPLSDLEYRVELREDPVVKSQDRTLPQPYQAALLLREAGERVDRGETVGFVKVRPFRHKGRTFTVKPVSQTNLGEVNVEDYVRNLTSSLSQTFEPMAIRLKLGSETSLTDFVG